MSLDGTYDEANVFARILRGDLPKVTVWEDDQTLAFMDVFPQSEGHVLVISKTSRARTLLEAEPEVLTRLMTTVQRVAKATRAALNPDGLSIMQFNGEAGGQTVFHLHFHIIPRWHGRAMAGHGEARMADTEALKATAARIAAAI